jgi:hypothetical protein
MPTSNDIPIITYRSNRETDPLLINPKGITSMNETYEAVFRIATALYSEYESTGVEGYITYQELARILNRFGYQKQAGGEYTETHGKALGQLASAAWHYIEQKYGTDHAHKIYFTIRDEHGNCRADTTDRRSRKN